MFGFFKKKFSFTDPVEPKVQVDTEKGVKNYLDSLSKISFEEVCIEFSNVMAAKHNLKMIGINNVIEKQRIVTDLTDKATIICIFLFGYQSLKNYSNNDMRVINHLINTFDARVAANPVEPKEHGRRLIEMLKAEILS